MEGVALLLHAVRKRLSGCEPCPEVEQLAVLVILEDAEVLVARLARALHLRRVGYCAGWGIVQGGLVCRVQLRLTK